MNWKVGLMVNHLEAFEAMRRNTAVEHLGIQFEEVGLERVVATMPVDHRTHQPFGLLHGGASVLLAETVASVGAQMHAGEGRMAVGMEINANHLRPKADGIVRATATPVHVGRSSSVWSIEIADEAGKLVCVSRCTLSFVPISRS
jgi:1,4-dihydroxy-2-naphthoyl-CoA hydrolase